MKPPGTSNRSLMSRMSLTSTSRSTPMRSAISASEWASPSPSWGTSWRIRVSWAVASGMARGRAGGRAGGGVMSESVVD